MRCFIFVTDDVLPNPTLEPVTPVGFRREFRVGGSHRRRGSRFWSLIWLEIVKQAECLRSEIFHFIRVCVTAACLSQGQEHIVAAV